MLTALLDTSVLRPTLRRDFLLGLAAEGLYRPIWSQRILDELTWAEAAMRVDLGAKQPEAEEASRRLTGQLAWAFDDSCVTGWEPLVGSYGLPDPDDEHVVAAAIVGNASVIVSDHPSGLPGGALPPGLGVVSPARFALDVVSVSPHVAALVLEALSSRRSPSRSVRDLLDALEGRFGLGEAVDLMRGAEDADEAGPAPVARRMRADG